MKLENPATPAPEPYDFSLVLGGPLYQIFRRAHLTGDALELLRRRIVVISLFAWVPLLVLALLDGRAWSGVAMPFLRDVDVHVRFLVALPLLILAEIVIHQRMRPVVSQFLERNLVPPEARAQFAEALGAAHRLRNSVLAEVLMIAAVYGIGVLIVWRGHSAVSVTSWYGESVGGLLQPSAAGWWFGCVSLPLFQFMLLRWYFRLFVWMRFLVHVARIDLKLLSTHPDKCGGLGFLSEVCMAFAPLLLAQGALLSGTLANQIFYAGAKLPQFKMEVIGMVAVALFAVLGPMLVFIPTLYRVKREGLRQYGALAQRTARELDDEWMQKAGPVVGAVPFFQAHKGFELARDMSLVPFTRQAFVQLTMFTLVPLIPLLLTMVSFEQLLGRLLKVVF
jgi:hypothetical protein